MVEFINKIQKAFGSNDADAFVVCMYSDAYEVLRYAEIDWNYIDIERLLDFRVFDWQKEYRIYRDYIGNEFRESIIDEDTSDWKERYDAYDDEQFLDIDLKRTEADSGVIKATGGGVYKFPTGIKDVTKVVIRNYVAYDENGQAYIKAWRLCGLTS